MNCKDCIHNEACEVVRDHECQDVYGYLTGGVFDGCPLFKNKAEFAKVVRCKDCYYKLGDNPLTCGHPRAMYQVHKDSFCSFGERKGGEG